MDLSIFPLTIMRSIHVHVPVNDNARMRMLNIHVHVPVNDHANKLINECTRPTQHIINVKKNIKETVNIALSI